jgi:uncharacterized FlaG/YvyC family protein
LSNWDNDELENEKIRTNETKQKIEKYNKWKYENKEEYEKLIKELNELVDNMGLS